MRLDIKADKGFTLIELLIVVAIIGIIAAIAIPSLLRSRMSANEAAAAGGCKSIATAQTDYHTQSSPHTFSQDLLNLGNGNGAGGVGFIDTALSSGLKSGYTFFLAAGSPHNNSFSSWTASAWPMVYQSTGVRSFYVDAHAVVRASYMKGVTGTSDMPPID